MSNYSLDSSFEEKERLPKEFTVRFDSMKVGSSYKTRVTIDGVQIGDVIDDNSREVDNYRFHDVFHYTFAALLGWSPCTRSMMKRKRKSNPLIDAYEDGARATITEEAISLMLFAEAKQLNFLKNGERISSLLLNQIKQLTSTFEVSVKSQNEWEQAIAVGYDLFRKLVENNGGEIYFNSQQQLTSFIPSA